jgi:hypothetical protein
MRYVITLIAVTLLFISSAWAVTVTGGFVTGPSAEDADYHMTGSNFSLACTAFTRCGQFDASGPLFVGTFFTGNPTVQMDTSVFISPGTTGFESNEVMWEGNRYRAFGLLNFDGPLIAPPAPGSLTAAFTMSGTLDLLHYETFAPLGTTLSLTGQGSAVGLFGNPGDLLSIRYDFANVVGNGTPVIPEPSTVLLVASGLAGIGLWRRRRKEPTA